MFLEELKDRIFPKYNFQKLFYYSAIAYSTLYEKVILSISRSPLPPLFPPRFPHLHCGVKPDAFISGTLMREMRPGF